MHHSDRSSQYASHEFQEKLKKCGMTCSMKQKGNCWDNAPMESWFNSFKNEQVLGIRHATHDDMKAASFEYIKVFYNQKRQHPTLGTVAHAIPGAVNQRAASGKTGSMKSTLWQTKNRGDLRFQTHRRTSVARAAQSPHRTPFTASTHSSSPGTPLYASAVRVSRIPFPPSVSSASPFSPLYENLKV